MQSDFVPLSSQIHMADEFDLMLTLQVSPRLSLAPLDQGLFYRIDLVRPTRQPVRAFLLENQQTVSSSKILSEMYRLVRKFLKTYKGFLLQTFLLLSFPLLLLSAAT